MKKFFYTIAWFGILSSFYFLLLITYWNFYPYKTLEFKGDRFKLLHKQVYQGDVVEYYSDYCKYIDESAIVSRSFVNAIIYSTPSSLTGRMTGCHKIIVQVRVPLELPIGTYHLENRYKYQVNPIRTIIVKQETEEFEVLESTSSAIIRRY